MVARTSVNGGVSWTAPQNLGISTLETPGLACNDKECMLKYMRASGNDPFVVTRRISVDSSGNINLHNWVQNNNRIQRSPLVGYSSSYADWMGGIVWYPTNGLRALGRGNIYTTATPSNPMTSFSWSFAAGQTYNSGSFATQGPFLKDYIFYIQ